MSTQVYKAVERLSDGTLVSYAAMGRSRVTYKQGVPAKAPPWLAEQGYHLLAYDPQQMDPWLPSPGVELWLAEGEEEILPLPQEVNVFDLAKGKLDPPNISLPWLKGTRMFKKITLMWKLDLRGDQ